MTFDAHRLSFGSVAEHYDRARPTYPAEAVAWAIGPSARRVLDLGAGTGKLTRVALGLGLDVVAVEPDPGMRAQLDAATPGQTALAGSAEEIPLPDASVDAVIVGQAYHWFTLESALPEIARVLKQGGAFAPIWNMRPTEEGWTKRLDEIMGGGNWDAHPRRANDPDFGPLFTPIEDRNFTHTVVYTRQRLRDLVASRSYFLVASPEQQAEVLAQVDELTEGFEELEMPYTTLVRKAFKR